MIDLVALGKVGGIAGVSLGIFLVVYRDVLRKKIFAKLPTKESYQLLRLIIVLTWTIAVLGLAAWLYGTYVHNEKRVATDWRVSGILDELEIGLNRDFVLKAVSKTKCNTLSCRV
ncbi:hypothetical protein, partial [Massilia brevitalea]|uniref:hypothetical protein n=1 Tax=Massilia brevitalea TaxID=442526 RepID=UPI002739F81A